MKMAPRPSSPTSLLWAHQIKRENGHLLGRIQKLESANQQNDNRLKAAESASKKQANEDLAALAEQVKAFDSTGVARRLEEIEKGVMAKLDDVQADSEAMILKMASLEKHEAVAEEERRKAFSKEKALLKRVNEVEEGLRKYQESLEKVGRKIEEGSVEVIRQQLEGLSRQVEREGADVRLMEESVLALELANAELRKANARLSKEVEEVAKKAVSVAAATPVDAAPPASKAASKRKATENTQDLEPDLDAEDGADETLQRPRKRSKKSHKWAGGGADKDIISQASQLNTPRPVRSSAIKVEKKKKKPTASQAKTAPKARAAAPTKPAAPSKPAAPTKPTAPTKPAAPSKPATQSKTTAARPPLRKGYAIKTKQSQQQMQRPLDADPDKPIIRAGKGWIEIAVSPSQSQDSEDDEGEEAQEASAPAKRRGRPPKQRPSQDLIDIAETTQRPTRGGARSQKPQTQKPSVAKKRKAEPDTVTGAQKYKPSGAMQGVKAAQNGWPEDGDVFRSPASSPRLTERRDAQDHLLEAVTSQPKPAAAEQPLPPPPAKRRRVIEQVSDI